MISFAFPFFLSPFQKSLNCPSLIIMLLPTLALVGLRVASASNPWPTPQAHQISSTSTCVNAQITSPNSVDTSGRLDKIMARYNFTSSCTTPTTSTAYDNINLVIADPSNDSLNQQTNYSYSIDADIDSSTSITITSQTIYGGEKQEDEAKRGAHTQ